MRRLLASVCFFVVACASPEGSGLAHTPDGTGAKVKFDVFHEPLPEIPRPNDFATRFDASSALVRNGSDDVLPPQVDPLDEVHLWPAE